MKFLFVEEVGQILYRIFSLYVFVFVKFSFVVLNYLYVFYLNIYLQSPLGV